MMVRGWCVKEEYRENVMGLERSVLLLLYTLINIAITI